MALRRWFNRTANWLTDCLICSSIPFAVANVPGDVSHAPPLRRDVDQPDIRFGLDKLHWGMTRNDVLEIYPNFEKTNINEPETRGKAPNSLSLRNYEFQGCHFDVELDFVPLRSDNPDTPGTLGYIGFFDFRSTAACASRIKAMLLKQIGSPDDEQHAPSYELIWNHRPTWVSFTDWRPKNKIVVAVTLLSPTHLKHALELKKKLGP